MSAKKDVELLHETVDKIMTVRMAIAKKQGLEVPCKKACAHCCYTAVGCSSKEVTVIISAAKKKNINIDFDRLRKQKEGTSRKSEPRFGEVYAFDHTKIKGKDCKCVFLDSRNMCQVYDVRPTSCRTHFTVETPESCDTFVNNGNQAAYLNNNEAILYSVEWGINHDPDWGLLHEMLLERRKELE